MLATQRRRAQSRVSSTPAKTGETHTGRAFTCNSLCFDSLIWNNQTTLAEATTSHPVKTPSRPRRVVQRLPSIPPKRERGSYSGFLSRQPVHEPVWAPIAFDSL